jgi:hypothetical protein
VNEASCRIIIYMMPSSGRFLYQFHNADIPPCCSAHLFNSKRCQRCVSVVRSFCAAQAHTRSRQFYQPFHQRFFTSFAYDSMDSRRSESSPAAACSSSPVGGAWSGGSILFWSLAGGAGAVTVASITFRMASMQAIRSNFLLPSICNLIVRTGPPFFRFCQHR